MVQGEVDVIVGGRLAGLFQYWALLPDLFRGSPREYRVIEAIEAELGLASTDGEAKEA